MAKVTNQDIPTTHIEDAIDPAIPFIDSYRRVLSEGISHPKAPPGVEIVTYSKKDSRPPQRNSATPGATAEQRDWRSKFSECIDCWRAQNDYADENDPCNATGDKHYRKDWHYVPGAKNTFYLDFMRDCLNWKREHQDTPYWRCDPENDCISPQALAIDYTTLAMGCGEEQTFSPDPEMPGCPPYHWELTGGGTIDSNDNDPSGTCIYRAPSSNPDCTLNPTLQIIDRCGTIAEINLAVNCYTSPTEIASSWCTKQLGPGTCRVWGCSGPYDYNFIGNFTQACKKWRCDGFLLLDCLTIHDVMVGGGRYDPDCYGGKPVEDEPCIPGNSMDYCWNGDMCDCDMPGGIWHPNNTYEDLRTPTMIAQGCCPLNPETGLPY